MQDKVFTAVFTQHGCRVSVKIRVDRQYNIFYYINYSNTTKNNILFIDVYYFSAIYHDDCTTISLFRGFYTVF